jgi:hypothetical protein
MTDFNTLILSITNRLNAIDNLVDSKPQEKSLPYLPDVILNNIIMMARPEKPAFVKHLENPQTPNGLELLKVFRNEREDRLDNIQAIYQFCCLLKFNKKNYYRQDIQEFKVERECSCAAGKPYKDSESLKKLLGDIPNFIKFDDYTKIDNEGREVLSRKNQLINDIINKAKKSFEKNNEELYLPLYINDGNPV